MIRAVLRLSKGFHLTPRSIDYQVSQQSRHDVTHASDGQYRIADSFSEIARTYSYSCFLPYEVSLCLLCPHHPISPLTQNIKKNHLYIYSIPPAWVRTTAGKPIPDTPGQQCKAVSISLDYEVLPDCCCRPESRLHLSAQLRRCRGTNFYRKRNPSLIPSTLVRERGV